MILVLVETTDQGPTETSLETLTFARTVDDPAGVTALLVGPFEPALTRVLAQELGRYGVTTGRHAVDDRLGSYSAAAWAGCVIDAARAVGADVVMAAGTPRGNEVMSHVAARLDVLMAANVVAVDARDPLVVSRQVMGGAVLEEMLLGTAPAVLTVAGHSTTAAPAEQATTPSFEDFSPELTEADLVGQVTRVEAVEKADTAALTGARVVVGAGRGAGGADGFGDLLELTDLLGGTLGVSRVVTSLGWRPHHEQVGQTGSRISPDVYIACGISGAIQHWAGCSTAKTIVAINTDADAPMVTKAHYAVIGDLHEVVPAINEELRRRLG
jgi:electron transfer flavoprotein alpha subunit